MVLPGEVIPTARPVLSFELWMVSNAAAGAAIGSFLTLLIPPFVTEVTGSPIP